MKRNPWLSLLVGHLTGRIFNSFWTKPFFLKTLDKKAILVTEYTHNISEEQTLMLRALNNRQGGPLGIEAVREIIVSVSDFAEKQARWQKLLSPIAPSAPGYWQSGEGPALRLEPGLEDNLQALLFKVTSLEKAKLFLSKNNLLEGEAGGEIKINPARIEGLDIRLAE